MPPRWWERIGGDTSHDAPQPTGRSVYETRFAPQDDDPDGRVVWTKLGEYSRDGLPLPGSPQPEDDWMVALARGGAGWQPLDRVLRRGGF